MEVLNGPMAERSGVSRSSSKEPSSWLLLIPLGSILVYYIFFYPSSHLLLVFTPLILTLFSLIGWWRWDGGGFQHLRLRKEGLKEAVLMGAGAGAVLALFNLFVILKLTVWFGHSYDFLQQTPHAHLPIWLMLPFGILLISFIVELLFRGWILGRLWMLTKNMPGGAYLSILLSALVFSFDPFMVVYFRGYHWLALSDGLVWGGLLLKTQNLASTIAAHTVEVWIVYFILKVFYA